MGNQDLFRVSGRDPVTDPLTPLEFKMFSHALMQHWEAEMKANPLAST
jgi:hypothetical protein